MTTALKIIVFRLEPINSHDARWQGYSHVETLWVGADSPTQARELVASATTPFAWEQKSNWYDDGMCLCVIDPDRAGVRAGEVLTSRGRRLN